MLSVACQDPLHHHHQQHLHLPFSSAPYPSHRTMPHREDTPVVRFVRTGTSTLGKTSDAAVAQALEIARESPDGASDPTVSKILEHSLSQIWGRVQSQPGSYVMSRDEFSVFNFFQHRFVGDQDAIAARKRYWDNRRA
ncbi:hypothetical protein E4U42_000430 [Claviceps africana]|uniref:Uncharacterized protein n=1 Tax=Claviceps africana TaxID=83212 RepID=A0A8K0NNA0_9HYPO|nr:hypothetical protein E4U42_000430 [Claviceps africana]